MQKRSNIIRYQKRFCKILANSRAMITKQQITINYTEESSIKRYKKKKIIRYEKNYWKISANSLPKSTKEQSRINYIEEINIKIDAKKKKKWSDFKKIIGSFRPILWAWSQNNKLELII